MSRLSNETDFTVVVEGVGRFVFGQRKMRDELAIQREFARIIDGVEPTAFLQAVGGWMSALKVLTVSAPDGWNPDDLDPLDDASYQKLKKVFDALTDQERSFRRPQRSAGEAAGA
jgi:hypothetical protein